MRFVSASVTGSAPALAPYEAISRPVLGWLTLLYAVLGYIGLHFDDGSGLVSAVWPASGLAAATVLRHGAPGFWVPALGNLILMLPVSMGYDQPFTVALAIAIGCAAANTGEAWLILRLSGGYGPQRLHDSRAFIRFAVVAAPLIVLGRPLEAFGWVAAFRVPRLLSDPAFAWGLHAAALWAWTRTSRAPRARPTS